MNNRIFRIITNLGALGAILTLVACGGGGGGDTAAVPLSYTGPTAPVVIGADNAGSLTNNAYDNLDDVGIDATGVLNTIPVAVQNGATEQEVPGLLGQTRMILDVLDRIRSQPTILPVGVTVSGTLACTTSGTVSWTAIQGVSNTVSSGDSYTLTFNECNESGIIITGAVSLSITLVSGTPGVGDYQLEGEYNNQGLRARDAASVTTFYSNGSVTFTESSVSGQRTTRATGSRFYLLIDNEQYLYTDFDFQYSADVSGYTLSADFTVASPRFGGTITVTTLAPFVFNAPTPSSGSFRVEGASGAWIQLDAVDTNSVSLSWDLTDPVDSTPDGTETILWTDLPTWRPPGL